MLKKALVLYGCQIYKAILPLVFTPILLNILGVERYGMIAFFYLLVGFLGLLDAGISGTFLKLIATNKDCINDFRKVTKLFVKVFCFFVGIALLLGLFFVVKSDFIVTGWINTTIDSAEAIYAIKSIGIVLASLYLKSYLSSFINGLEKQEWLNIWSVFYNTFFYFGSYAALQYIDNSLFVFFDVMIILAVFDLFIVILLSLIHI